MKITDGLFLGDEFAARDIEHIFQNKVSMIVNCSAGQLANLWIKRGVRYLSYRWKDDGVCKILDPRDRSIFDIERNINEAHENGDSVLIHSIRGHNRSVVVIVAYFMLRYRWSLGKVLEFVQSRKKVNLKPGFLA